MILPNDKRHSASYAVCVAGIRARDAMTFALRSRTSAEDALGGVLGDASERPAPSGHPTTQNAADANVGRPGGIVASTVDAPEAAAADPALEHSVLLERYLKHVALAESTGSVWNIAAARGLYRLLADIECAGGKAAPMGMPHILCITDTQVRQQCGK